MNERIEFVISQFAGAGIAINEQQADQFVKLCDFMVEYNENVNLTSITEFSEVVVKHFVDSVLPFTMVDIPRESSFIDVGTGAGFPALPLLIFRPDLRGTLCDSLNKRCVYLEKACSLVGIKAEIIHARSEELGRKNRECFDFATARAVAAMPVLSEYCIPFVKVGGKFIALKSVNENISEAKSAISKLGGEIELIRDYTIPNGDARRLAVIKKISQTPTKYPRNSGNIQKKPL
ncbi:MAG: 16S rRNA (guanine(527)-N(7))-methyltransferase RsmG [Oscillospiraceae bacterium]|nr:16S rRNA (guanine(527)-N(7))-methyltransferase RsmG [Oscillospiraceae bacterium]